MPRPLVLLLLSVLLGGAAMLIHEPDELRSLQREADRLQERLDGMAEELAHDARHWAMEVERLGPQEWMREHMAVLDADRENTGTVHIVTEGDSIVAWSGQLPVRPSRLIEQSGASFISGKNIFLHSSIAAGAFTCHTVRPVWIMPPIENRYIQGGFHPSLGVAQGAAVAEGGQLGPEVKDPSGKVMFRMAWRDGTLETGNWIWLRSLLLLFAAALLLAGLWALCRILVQRGHPFAGALAFASIVVGVRAWWLFLPPMAPFDRSPMFDPAIYATSFAFPSLGDLLINAILIMVIGSFVRMALRPPGMVIGRPFLMFLAWLVLFVLAQWIGELIIGLVENSSVDMDLYHVQGLSLASVLALLSMALLFGAWSLIGSVLIGSMVHSGKWRMIAITGTIALLLSAVLHHQMDGTLLQWIWPVPIILLLLAPSTDRPGYAPLVLGLVIISAFSAVVLTRYTGDRERREREVLAERLATREDPVVELLFQEVAPQLRRDRSVYAMLSTGRACSTSDLDARVRQRFFGGYWERYDVRLFAFGTHGRVLCATDPEPPRSFRGEQSIFTDPLAAADMPDLLMEELPGQGTFYHARVSIMPVDTLPPAQLIVELYPRALTQGLGFPELLVAGDDPLARRVVRYAFARYEQGQLAEQSGPFAYPMRWSRQLDADGKLWYEEGGAAHFATRTPTGSVLVLRSPEPTWLDKATTFSYLFTFFSLLLALSIGVRTLWFRGPKHIGISLKVRMVLVLFAITSLLFFGIGTRSLLNAQYVQRIEKAILEKARSVHNELQQKLDGEPVLTRDHAPYLDHLLGRASNIFFTDITLYSINGRMLATSRPQMFTSGLLGRRMDPVAYTQLVLNGRSSYVQEESIGKASFRSAYLPLLDRSGTVLAYLSLPTFADQRQQEEERASVLVAVVNLFVLMFALSVLVAVFISNWTLRPLDLLKRSLSGVDLRRVNEPIEYEGDDEVGQLVKVYNQKVRELHESAELLAKSERETAWREMARQVAHEIKNPLTPMKLGIQQFQRSWDPKAPDAKARLDRFTKAMVEQIDSLNGVATAFGQFAQMPVAQPQELHLNAVVRSAVDVFRATPDISIGLREESDLFVLADREHLLRVFNNLLKNSAQAIPDEREGRIEVELKRQGNDAIVEVRDNGEGMTQSVRDRIFSPSFTTKSSGMGLGLAMVKRIVEQAGGRVWFETREGEGTTFFVSLPLLDRTDTFERG